MKFFSIIILIFVIGCGAKVSDQDREYFAAQRQSESDNCAATNIDYFAYTYCDNKATEKYFQNLNFPYPEVITAAGMYRIDLAGRVVSGELTHEQLMYMYLQYTRMSLNNAVQEQSERRKDRAAMKKRTKQTFTCYQSGDFISCY